MIASLLVRGSAPGQTVDLALVRRSENVQDHLVPQSRVGGEVIGLEVNAFAGAAAHDHAGDTKLGRS